ncbi:hypothetical protein B0H17DRAFT_1102069 [Mycena rosella]|uniref:DUF6533 domain-containing protein n=1 Tax=Mycena rosella TaxID=1033263 RepID=A0AAD7G3I0_MYCRO|nr:hypothetical protein B0H17DRAFT_1102069 [Mycena rosella]
MPGPALSYGPDHYSAADAVDYVDLTYISNYVLYATACLLVYEWVTSLDDEVNRIWTLKWRAPKILYMLNTYFIRPLLLCLWILADFPGTSPEFCRIYAYWQMIPLRLAILVAQALVVIRVWAIYNNSRRMFWVLTTLYTLEVIAVTTCVAIATMDTQGVAQPVPLSCDLNSISGYLLKYSATGTWLAPVCFEFIMVLITLAKLVPRWKFGSKGFLGSGGNATLDILARDSLIYFGFIFTFSLTNSVIYELSFSAHYHSILLGPTSAISCIAVSRMMINMRSLPSSPLAEPTSTVDAYARPDLSFAMLPTDAYDMGGIPDTARTAYFDPEHSGGYLELRPGGHALPHAQYGRMPRPGSARTSGDATRVGDVESGSESGSIIEMELRKVL